MKNKSEVKKQADAIAENLKRLKEGKACAEMREQELLKLQNKLREEVRKCDFAEKKELIESSFDEVQSTVRIIKNWIEEIDTEIERVALAHDAIHTNDIEELRNALKAYVLSDTALSVKNITMALYDFDQLILSGKKFVRSI